MQASTRAEVVWSLWRRRAVLIGLLVAAAVGGCGQSPDSTATPQNEPRALTADEAELLAITRFKNYQAERVAATLEFPGAVSYAADVDIDYTRHAAWGEFTTTIDGEAGQQESLAWNPNRIYTSSEGTGSDGELPGLNSWYGRDTDPTAPFDNFLVSVLQLASDRPENPQLLRQSSARFLRNDQVDDVDVKVFSGPEAATESGTEHGESRIRFWVDSEGNLLRFEAFYSASEDESAQVTLADTEDVPKMPATVETLLQIGQSQ